MYSTIEKCRICQSSELTPVFSLGEQALTGVFPASLEENVISGPVDLVMCTAQDGCGLVQLLQSYDLHEMYGLNYGYRSGLNKSMVDHLRGRVQKILDIGILSAGDLIIDIGSNDSTTLKCYPDKYELVGIDPTGVKFAEYYPPEIRLISEFFSEDACVHALDGRKAKVITSFSMFYDLEDPIAFAQEISKVLDEEGIWVLEQSYLPSMLRMNSFDTICHEHLEFYGLKQIKWVAEAAGMKILDVDFNDINGGSFAIVISKANSKHIADTEKIEQILAEERELGLDSPRVFEEFVKRITKAGEELVSFLDNAKASGLRVSGLGASTKGNVLLQFYKIGADSVSEIGEVNSDKFGKFTPATGIQLLPEDEVLMLNPDYLLVLPWHFRKFFEESDKFKGQRLIFPLPKFEIVEL